MDVKNEIQFIGIDNLNEYQLSCLYLHYCIQYNYKGSYLDFVKQRETKYPEYKYVFSHAAVAMCMFRDKFRPGSIKTLTSIKNFA